MWFALLAPAHAQAPPPLSPDARFALALYCDGTCSQDVMDALDDGLTSIQAKDGFPDQATRPVRVMGLAGPDFGIPDADFIEAYGEGVDRPEALAKSQEVLLAWIAGPRNQALETLATAHAAFLAAARKGGGWVEDLDTQRVYGAEAWGKLDPRGPITDWFVVDADAQDEGKEDGPLRLVTRGLRRYGDFELVVEDVDPDSAGDVSFVVNTLAEELRKRPAVTFTMPIETGSVKGTATFRTTPARDGDPEEPLLRATFQGEITLPPIADEPPPVEDGVAGAGAPLAIPVEEAPVQPAPPAPPPPVPAPLPATAPASLADAQRLARDRFAHVVRPAWQAGLAPGEAVAVKAPFRARNGGNEYMWVELRSARGEELTGELLNEPYAVDGLHKGDTVTFTQAEIFDYLWKKADGSREGNTTARFVASQR